MGSEYKIEKEIKLKSTDSIFLSVADASTIKSDKLIDFTIRLEDLKGNTSDVLIKEYCKLQNKLEISITKFSF